MREALSYGELGYAADHAVTARSSGVLVNALLDGLLYGDAERGLRSGLQVSPDTFDLMQRDGCSVSPVPVVQGLESYWYSLEQCEAFMSGLLSNGLASSIKLVRACARGVWGARLRATGEEQPDPTQTTPPPHPPSPLHVRSTCPSPRPSSTRASSRSLPPGRPATPVPPSCPSGRATHCACTS